MREDEFEKLKREKEHLKLLIASAGKAAPKQWRVQLDKISENINQKNFEGASIDIRRTHKDIKHWMLIKGGQLVMMCLALLMIIEIVHWYLMKLENRNSLVCEAFQMNIVYPRFICCNEYYEIFICVRRKKAVNFELEIHPSSNEFWIRGDKWHKNIETSNVSRNDWRPEILYKPKESFLRMVLSPEKWPNMYPKEEMVIALRNTKGEQIGYEAIVFRVIRFYYQLTGIVAVLIIALKAHKYRITGIFQYILKR